MGENSKTNLRYYLKEVHYYACGAGGDRHRNCERIYNE